MENPGFCDLKFIFDRHIKKKTNLKLYNDAIIIIYLSSKYHLIHIKMHPSTYYLIIYDVN